MFEVEQKYRVDNLSDVREAILREFPSVKRSNVINQTDIYFNHPNRDFAQTDEALRIRSTDNRLVITYKGPRHYDTAKGVTTKTRREIEVDLGIDHLDMEDSKHKEIQSLLEILGFKTVLCVPKQRENLSFNWNGWPISIALDEVDGLGCFVEIEVIANSESLTDAQNCVREISNRFGFENEIRSSYLELLIKADNDPPKNTRHANGSDLDCPSHG